MTADTPENVSCGDEELISPGERLQRGREALGLSQREVAAQLKLLPQQIDYLEADEFHRFNGDIFCKAHLRSYAGLLGLNPEELVAQYREFTGGTCRHQGSGRIDKSADRAGSLRNTGSQMQVQRPGRGHSLRYWGVATAASLAVILWFSQPDSVESPLPVSDVVDPNDQSTLEVLDADKVLSAADSSAAELLDDFAGADQESVVLDLPAGAASANSVAGAGAEQSLGLTGPDQLRFSFSADCWVEVSDGDGITIFAALKRAQDSLVLQGKGPFKVLLGYAHGVSLNYNGEPIEINVNNRNNSARLVVGNLPVR